MDKVLISKRLSYILRHGALDRGLRVMNGGFVAVADILALPEFRQVDKALIHTIVAEDAKNRYSMSQDGKMIRAHQGHSFKVPGEGSLLRQIQDPAEIPVCIHGTYSRFLDSILKSGLNRMKRQHIHFASGTAAKSGMRHDCDVHIHVDVWRAMRDGCAFYMSENGVILSPGMGDTGVIPPEYFSVITHR